MSSTLLQYLAEPNPVLNNVHSLSGLPTRCEPQEDLRTENWSEFNYETLMSCYGHILRRQYSHSFPNNSPPLSALECDIFDEDSLDHLLSRSIVPAVSQGLRKAWEHCYPGKLEIDVTRGGRARHTQAQASNEPRSSNSSGSELEGTKMFPIGPESKETQNMSMPIVALERQSSLRNGIRLGGIPQIIIGLFPKSWDTVGRIGGLVTDTSSLKKRLWSCDFQEKRSAPVWHKDGPAHTAWYRCATNFGTASAQRFNQFNFEWCFCR